MGKRTLERRFLQIADVDLRADGEGLTLEGYAAVFGQEAVIWDAWREEVAPGAYAKTIQENDIRALFNHDENIVLGRNRAGTLKLAEDGRGLKATITAPDNEWGRPVVDAVRRGDVTGMSVLFKVIKHEWSRAPEGSRELPKRTIKEARLFDAGPVTFPAFVATSIAARSEDGEPDEIEDVLAEARRIERCVAHGMGLTRADREVLERAVGLLRERMGHPEPEAGEEDRARGGDSAGTEGHAGAHHSEGEPEAGEEDRARGGDSAGAEGHAGAHHSADERARWLALVEQSL